MNKHEDKSDLIYIYNKRQSFYYMQHNVLPKDCNINKKSLKMYFVFSRKESEEVYKMWCEECEKYNNSKLK